MSSTISVTVAQAEVMTGSGLFVADTAANIVQGLAADPGLVSQVASFTLSAAGTVTAAMAARLGGLGTKFHLGGQALTVQDSLANLALAGNAAGVALATSVQVVDAAYNLLNAASTRFTHVSSVVLTGSPILTAAQLTRLEALPHFSIASGSAVTLSDTVAAISAALSAHAGWFTPLATISVHLDGSTIGAYTAGLLNTMISNGKHVTFVPSAGDSTLNITAAAHDIAASAAALRGLATHIALAFTVTNPAGTVTAADAAALAGLTGFGPHLATLNVADTAAAIDMNAALFTSNFAAITVTSGVLYGTIPQLVSPRLHLQGTSTAVLVSSGNGSAAVAQSLSQLHGFALGAGVTLTVQDSYANIVSAANAGGYAFAKIFTIIDTGANLATAAAHNWGTATPTYVLSGISTVSAAQLATLSAPTLAFSFNGYALDLADTVANVLGLSKTVLGNAGAIAITDVSANVTTAALNLLSSNIHAPLTIMLTDAGHVRVTAAAYLADHTVIDDITYATSTIVGTGGNSAGPNSLGTEQSPLAGSGAVIVTGSSQQILNIANTVNVDPHVGGVAITDNSEVLSNTYFDTLREELSVPVTITVTDPTDRISVLSATYANDTAQVDAIQNAADLEVTGGASDLAPLVATLAADYRINFVVLTDTATALDAQAAALMPLADKLAIITTAGGTVGPATLALLASCVEFSLTGTLVLAGTVAGVTGLTSDALAIASSVLITDVATSVTAAALNSLEQAVPGILTSITLTDTGKVGVNVATYSADLEVIDKIANAGAVTVTDSTAALNGLAGTSGSGTTTSLISMLVADPVVGSIVASDTAANIVADIGVLLNVGPKLSVSLTDTLPITAALVPQLALLPVANAAHIVIADTGANIAAVVEAASTATLNFLTAASVKLSANSIVVAADAKALEGLSSFSNAGHTLAIWDTVAHLTSGLYTATIANSDVSALYLQTNGAPVSLSAATMLTMLALPHFHDTNPDGSANLITISDSAAHLTAAFTTLQADAAQLGNVSFVVNANATVSEAMLAQLQTLSATALQGVSLTVRDTAAAIATDLLGQSLQITSPSISASAYTLSGSSTVSLNTAAILGVQINFSAGPYTLTVNQTTNQTITIGGANDLGNLGSALVLTGGGQLSVAGNLAQLAALNAGAQALVTSNITDSFSNIVAPIGGLTAQSPLLDGTLTVSDAENITAVQAQSFFGLIQVPSTQVPNPGIAAANVMFGTNVEAVTGDIADLQTLTGLPAWSQSPTLTSAFTLTAADSVANLIAPGNTTFLAGLKASELAANATTNAASAEKLFGLQTQIHYTTDGSALTVRDTAAHLLNPNYADGLGLADTILLSVNDTTNAAGAETLLSNTKFDLTQVLTIMDAPQNLLDPTLTHLLSVGDYGSNVLLELNAPTTTDASTAAALVNLTGFTDPSHDLTISDHPSFLIDPTYLAAETAATTVTIPGDETVSAATVLRLSEVPHFTPGANHLILAANDVVDDPTLAAIGDFGTSYNPNGHTITMTQDDTSLTQAEYNALQSDNVVTNGHLFSAAQPTPTLTFYTEFEGGGTLDVRLQTQGGGFFSAYDHNGATVGINSLSSTQPSLIDVNIADSTNNYAFTETSGSSGSSSGTVSNPVIMLDVASLTSAAGGAGFSTTATPGAVSFNTENTGSPGTGTTYYLPLYTAGSVPTLTAPALVYDPVAHTLSLDAHANTVLITLGGTDFPSSLVASEIGVKYFAQANG